MRGTTSLPIGILYGNTQNIKIAVANNDKGTTNDLVGELNAGDEVIDKLKDNDQLGWTIVDSEKEAKKASRQGSTTPRSSSRPTLARAC